MLLLAKIQEAEKSVKYPQTILTKIDENFSLKTTTIILSIPENNKRPWGLLSGKVIDAAP